MDTNLEAKEIEHIDKIIRYIGMGICALLFLTFSVLQFYYFIVPEILEYIKTDKVSPYPLAEFMRLMWLPIIAYGLIATNVCLFTNAIIGKPLNKSSSAGLLGCFILIGPMFMVLGILYALTIALSLGVVFSLMLCTTSFLAIGIIVATYLGLTWEMEYN